MRRLSRLACSVCLSLVVLLSFGSGRTQAYVNLGITRDQAAELDRRVKAAGNITQGQYYEILDEVRRLPKNYSYKVQPEEKIPFDGPFVATVYCKRAVERMNARRLDDAVADLKDALRLDPKSHTAYWLRAQVRFRQELWKNAEDDLTAAIQLNQGFDAAYCLRAQLRVRLGDYQGCHEDFQKAMELAPRSVSVRAHRAIVIISLGDEHQPNLKRALALAEEACLFTSYRDAECLQVLAAVHARRGEFNLARQWQREALELISENDDVDAHRDAHRRLGHYERHQWNVIDFDREKIDEARPTADASARQPLHEFKAGASGAASARR